MIHNTLVQGGDLGTTPRGSSCSSLYVELSSCRNARKHIATSTQNTGPLPLTTRNWFMMDSESTRLVPANIVSAALVSPGEPRIHSAMPTYVKELIAGGVAGGFTKTVVAPLERVKILYQTNSGNFRSIGILRSLQCILKNEGLLGLYKGNAASVIRAVPYAALHFMTYEQYRRWMTDYYPGNCPGDAVELFAGSLAGGTAILLTYPLDMVRTRLAHQVNAGPHDKTPNTFHRVPYPAACRGISNVLSQVYKEHGFRGLYCGVAPTLYGMLPYAGLKFYIYAKLKSAVPADQRNYLSTKLACGAMAGLIGQTFIYPLDVVRRQMQMQTAYTMEVHTKRSCNSTLHGLLSIARMQGWQQLFAGLGINHMKLVPSVAIGFAAYDSMKSWLDIPPHKHG